MPTTNSNNYPKSIKYQFINLLDILKEKLKAHTFCKARPLYVNISWTSDFQVLSLYFR